MANFRKLVGKTFVGFEFEGNRMCEFNSDKKALLGKVLTIVHVEEERGYVEASEVALGKLYRFPLLVVAAEINTEEVVHKEQKVSELEILLYEMFKNAEMVVSVDGVPAVLNDYWRLIMDNENIARIECNEGKTSIVVYKGSTQQIAEIKSFKNSNDPFENFIVTMEFAAAICRIIKVIAKENKMSKEANFVEIVQKPKELNLVDCVKDSSFIGFINPEGKIKTYAVNTSGGFQMTRPYSVVLLGVISRKRSMKELVNYLLKMDYRAFKFETHQDLVNWLKH